MGRETRHTLIVASDIVVALIDGGAGLATGAIGSLVAPWANWGIEKRRLNRQGRVERIRDWRDGVDLLDWTEKHHGQRSDYDGSIFTGDIHTKTWYVTMRPEMSKAARDEIEQLAEKPINQRFGEMSRLIVREIARIERDDWKLV